MDEYISRNDLFYFFKDLKWDKYKHLKFTYYSDIDCSIRGDSIEIQNEFGSKIRKYFDILTKERLKSIIQSLIKEVTEIDREKYREQILNNATKNMLCLTK